MEKQTIAPFTFSISQLEDEGMYMWMLFVNERVPSDYDIQVTDYQGTFPNARQAASWYESHFKDRLPAVIVFYDGNDLNIKFYAHKIGDSEPADVLMMGWFCHE
jgi:hypothetical protein